MRGAPLWTWKRTIGPAMSTRKLVHAVREEREDGLVVLELGLDGVTVQLERKAVSTSRRPSALLKAASGRPVLSSQLSMVT